MDILSILHNSRSLLKNRHVPRQAVMKTMEGHFFLELHDAIRFETLYYDTFDWRVYESSHICCYQDKYIHLLEKTNKLHLKEPYKSKAGGILNLEDVPDGIVKTELMKVTGIRKLMHRGSIESNVSLFNARNRDEKIVARCLFETYSARRQEENDKHGMLIHLQPLKGYEDETNTLAALLSEIGVKPLRITRTMFLLSECGSIPGDYSSKFVSDLQPSTTTLESLRAVFRQLFRTMEVNEEGIRRDIDPEFLHDFRVAIRRMRSAVSIIRGVFPKEVRKEIRNDFKEIASHTSTLRDLDVYLGKKEEYTSLLPPSLKKDIQPFFRSLSDARKDALGELTRYLAGDEYSSIMSRWKTFAETRNGERSSYGPNAFVPVSKTASRVIIGQFADLIKDCRNIGNDSTDEDLHTIRIDFKRLRYLLEFFSSLFPGKKKKKLLKTLKEVQDILGNFNDCSVQITTLEKRIEDLEARGGANLKEAVAIGAVITHLQLRKQRHIKEFLDRLGELTSPRLEASFKTIFGGW